MDLSRQFQDYLYTVKNTFETNSSFNYKVEKYGCIDKCTHLLNELNNLENDLNNLIQKSKTSSLFNEAHLKFTTIGSKIESSIKAIEKKILIVEKQDSVKYSSNKFEYKTITNSLNLLNIRLQNINGTYQKFLKTQGDTIRTIEKRKNNLVNNRFKKSKKSRDDMYSSLPDNDIEDNSNVNNIYGDGDDINLSNIQKTVSNSKNDDYYKERMNVVDYIEKSMIDLSTMFKMISQKINLQGEMLNKIDNDTVDSFNNLTMAENEIIQIKDSSKSNRKLILKIFAIILFFVITYIVFLS